jgi:hypothetical protein
VEVSEDKLLERFYLILEIHEVGNSLIPSVERHCRYGEVTEPQKSSPLVRIVDILEADVFLIFEETIELGMMPMKSKFR